MKSYSHLARLYDGFMDNVDYPAWAAYASRLVRRALGLEKASPPSSPVRLLECGCGTGNITVPLARLGYDVTASDISDEMLAVASEKARKAGLKIPFVKMDMRALALHRPLDAVIACCDCVNYLLSEQEASGFFKSAYAVLKTGGALAFDISSAFKLKNILGCSAFTDSNEVGAYFWQNNYDEKSRLIEMKLEFFTRAAADADGESLYKRSSETHIQRAHTEKELISLMEKAGFSRIETFDCFTFEPVKNDSERIQFLAIK